MNIKISTLLFTLMLLASFGLFANQEGLEPGMSNPGYHDKPAWFKDSFLDIREDIQESTDNNKRTILYFYQDGCPYCAKLLNDNFGQSYIADKTQKYFDVIAINMWGDKEVLDLKGNTTTEKQFASALRVQYTPTLLMLNETGKVILRINGYFAPNKFNVALDFVAGKHEKRMRFQEYYAKNKSIGASTALNTIVNQLPSPLRLKDAREDSYRPLMVIFEERNCSDCNQLHQDDFRRPLIAYALTNLDIAIVDVDAKDKLQTPDGRMTLVKDWVEKLNIKYTPSMLFFDHQGKEVFRTEAYLRAFHIHGAIDYVVSGAYKSQPNFQRYLQHRTDTLHARGFEVDLME